MTETDTEFKDSFEPVLRDAHALMRAKEGDKACELLADAALQAVEREASMEAALFTSVRGSYLVALGRDEAALRAYLEAERLGESQASYRLTTARHLIFGMKRPHDALAKIDSLTDKVTSPFERLETHSIRGIALLSLGDGSAAVAQLEKLAAEMPADLPAVSRDLTLVDTLLRESTGVEVCRRYLAEVEAKAKEEGEVRVLEQVEELKILLPP